MTYTLTFVGNTDTSTPEAMAQAEQEVETKARSYLDSLPHVTNARAEFASGKVVDLLAPTSPAPPAETPQEAPSYE